MAIVTTSKDLDALTMVVVADFKADVERVWQLWADPRQLERWWGPPDWPATFTRHDFVPGGESRYHMTGPDGEQPGGYWRMTAVDAPNGFTLEDGFTDDDGNPVPGEPVVLEARLSRKDGGTRMTLTNTFASAAQLQQMVEMGMEEGLAGALGQIDELLAERAA
ncbi:MAG: SRPBCC domain-containing protein [Propionibacteriaceae bacterium]|nr:SRPBCC domain-containing protein [Propionibacteriaceae bacterium]